MLHPPKKTGATLHPYFPIKVTSPQRPLFLCPHGGRSTTSFPGSSPTWPPWTRGQSKNGP